MPTFPTFPIIFFLTFFSFIFPALLPNDDKEEKKRQQMVEDIRVYITMGIIIGLAFLVTVLKAVIQKSFKEQEEQGMNSNNGTITDTGEG